MTKKKLAILGASYLQKPLVLKAVEMNIETHVFAWKEGNVVEDICDYYYNISILDKEKILEICKKIEVNGVISIASDVAMPTVNYIASQLNLVGNSLETTLVSTNKFEMRKTLAFNNIKGPKFNLYSEPNFLNNKEFNFPVIVKPTDSSGSRGVTKILKADGVNKAIKKALKSSIGGFVIVEEFIEGKEFSVEMISYKGQHYELAITDKVKTGAPFFVEKEHHQPANISHKLRIKINEFVKKALTALKFNNGASHTEIIITNSEEIRIVEIGGRMGGDFIGSDLVFLSTGYDYLKAVINVCLDIFSPPDYSKFKNNYSGVYFVLPKFGEIKEIQNNSQKIKDIIFAKPLLKVNEIIPKVVDSSSLRAGVILYKSEHAKVNLVPEEILNFETL